MIETIQKLGLGVFLIGLTLFCALVFMGNYKLSSEQFEKIISNKGIKSQLFIEKINANVIDKKFSDPFKFSSAIILLNWTSTLGGHTWTTFLAPPSYDPNIGHFR